MRFYKSLNKWDMGMNHERRVVLLLKSLSYTLALFYNKTILTLGRNMKLLNDFQIHIACLVITMAMSFGCTPRVPQDGVNGAPGTNGTDGSSCSVVQLANGAEIKCGDNTSAVVLNGVDGMDGTHSVIDMITPCYDATKAFQEVLLVLDNNTLLAHYSHGSKQFLVVLRPGNYVTTDGFSCSFTVTPELNVVW